VRPEIKTPPGRSKRYMGMIILKWFLKEWDGCNVDFMHMLKDRDKFLVFVNMVMNLWLV
jgi:hypothetical protein